MNVRQVFKLLGFLIPVLLIVQNCAPPVSPAPTPPQARQTLAVPQTVPTGSISFPSGWDDSTIDKIKEGKSLKKILAVLDFEGNERLRDYVDLKMSDMLTTSLVKTGRYDLVERNKIDRALEEQSLGLTGIIDEATAASMGKLLGAEYVVFGSITSVTREDLDKFGYMLIQIKVGVDVRAINSSTGKILMSESAIGLSESKLVRSADGTVVSGATDYNSAYAKAARDAIQIVGEKISSLTTLLGFVVATTDDGVLIDVGEEQGIAKGDKFVIFRVGNEILHPATGKHIGWLKTTLREVIIVSTEMTMSTGTAIMIQNDLAPQPGDFAIAR